MSSELRKQIYANLNSKDTEELLDIWKTNDRVEWSDLAYEVLKEILTERVNTLPQQNEPIFEKDEEETADNLEDWETKILDSENQPELYDTLEVIDTVRNINKVAKASIFIYAFVFVIDSSPIKLFFGGGMSILQEDPFFILNGIETIFVAVLQIAVVFFSLKALSHILRILMEMEFNSRKQ